MLPILADKGELLYCYSVARVYKHTLDNQNQHEASMLMQGASPQSGEVVGSIFQ